MTEPLLKKRKINEELVTATSSSKMRINLKQKQTPLNNFFNNENKKNIELKYDSLTSFELLCGADVFLCHFN